MYKRGMKIATASALSDPRYIFTPLGWVIFLSSVLFFATIVCNVSEKLQKKQVDAFKFSLWDSEPKAQYDVKLIFGPIPKEIRPPYYYRLRKGGVQVHSAVKCPAGAEKDLLRCSPTGPCFRIRAGPPGEGKILSCSCRFKAKQNVEDCIERVCHCSKGKVPREFLFDAKAPFCTMKEVSDPAEKSTEEKSSKPRSKLEKAYRALYESAESLMEKMCEKGMVLLRTTTVRLQYWTVIVREFGWASLFRRPYVFLLGDGGKEEK